MSKYHNMASEILEAIGGSNNVSAYTNCMTRLRITPVNRDRINEKAIKKVNGVLGVVDDETYQIILGPGVVTKVAEQFDIVVAQGKEKSVGSSIPSAEDLQAKGAEMKAQQKKKIIHPLKHF